MTTAIYKTSLDRNEETDSCLRIVELSSLPLASCTVNNCTWAIRLYKDTWSAALSGDIAANPKQCCDSRSFYYGKCCNNVHKHMDYDTSSEIAPPLKGNSSSSFFWHKCWNVFVGKKISIFAQIDLVFPFYSERRENFHFIVSALHAWCCCGSTEIGNIEKSI